jgi:hypothetical protein
MKMTICVHSQIQKSQDSLLGMLKERESRDFFAGPW